jgi:magnesium chelatase subunit D
MTAVLTEQQFPFAAVVGHTLAKRALLFLAIEPRLGGVIIAARPGTAKTILARSLHALLPDIKAVKGCLSHCDRAKPQTWCSECKAKYRETSPESVEIRPPFINLPLNVTEDRLLGGLSLEATLQTGRRVAERGLLAEANRGVLYCDELNLLESGTGNYLMDSLSRGRLALEREGLSADYPTNFVLIGTFNPDEGEVRQGLSDRVGLMVSVLAASNPAERVEIINRALLFDRQPENLTATFADETAILQGLIAEAQEVLPQVQISDEQLKALSEIALRLGVSGNRVDLFTAWAAKASAALEGRTEINEDDLKSAVQMVLLPRATQMPEPPPPDEPEPPEPPEPPEQNEQEEEEEPPENQQQEEPQIEDLVLTALETELPADILALMQARQQRAKSGSRGETYNWKRGRHIQSVPGEPGQGRIAITATLRAAAPFQNIRKNEKPVTPVTPVTPAKKEKTARVQVRADDLRIKRYKDKAGVLFVFVVDASGSMALNRMREAKGAVTQLLQQAYVHRDKVALIAFRGKEAEVLLPPSQSVELAKRSLDILPTGGGTPLSSALMAAHTMSESAKRQGIFKTMIVLITDGRGNVLLNEDDTTANLTKEERKNRATNEVEQLAGMLMLAGLSTVVLDTQTNFLSKGEAATLARKLGGNYIYLPRADARVIANTVSNAAESLR